MPFDEFDAMKDSGMEMSIFDLFTSLVEMLADFMVHGFGILIILNAATILAFKCSLYCVNLLWKTLLSMLQVNLPAEMWNKNQALVTEAKKKRKTSSPSTDSSKADVTDEWVSESEGENERVESTTISFVDVSKVEFDLNDENMYRECETSTPSVDLTSQQSDLRQMLLDMSRRMDEMQEKFDKRLQSVESQLTEISQNKNRETPTADSKSSVSVDQSPSSEEQEADSLTESQADAQSADDRTNSRGRFILPHITSHVQNCYRISCDTCRALRRISYNIEEEASRDANSPNSGQQDVHRANRRANSAGWIRRRNRTSRLVTPLGTAQCEFCSRHYDDVSQLVIHLERHTVDDEKFCCHCAHMQS